jgi:hypothetical protein
LMQAGLAIVYLHAKLGFCDCAAGIAGDNE